MKSNIMSIVYVESLHRCLNFREKNEVVKLRVVRANLGLNRSGSPGSILVGLTCDGTVGARTGGRGRERHVITDPSIPSRHTGPSGPVRLGTNT